MHVLIINTSKDSLLYRLAVGRVFRCPRGATTQPKGYPAWKKNPQFKPGTNPTQPNPSLGQTQLLVKEYIVWWLCVLLVTLACYFLVGSGNPTQVPGANNPTQPKFQRSPTQPRGQPIPLAPEMWRSYLGRRFVIPRDCMTNPVTKA